MKKLAGIAVAAAAAVLSANPVFAHHPAEDIVDDEIYEMIDALVMDTPHADLVFEDMGVSTDITLTTPTVSSMENLIDDGLLDLAAMLGDDVEVNIDFDDDGDVSLTIVQPR